jgi:hypothetical protein
MECLGVAATAGMARVGVELRAVVTKDCPVAEVAETGNAAGSSAPDGDGKSLEVGNGVSW